MRDLFCVFIIQKMINASIMKRKYLVVFGTYKIDI